MDITYQINRGFDRLEKEGPYSWHWATEKEAELRIINDSDRTWVCDLLFTVGMPPGVESRSVDIFLNGFRVGNIVHTKFCTISIILRTGENKLLRFATQENLIQIDSDDRCFAFQLFDFRIEVKEEFILSTGLERIQGVQLDLLNQFIKICDRYNLKYYAIYGSLLGAVRHQGMIPWDDDIDVAMFRQEYDRFLEIADRELSKDYYLQIPEKGEECFFGGYAKLRNSNTTALDQKHIFRNCNQGISIDIFPLDNLPLEKQKRKYLLKRIECFQKAFCIKKYGFGGIEKNKEDIIHLVGYWILSKIYSDRQLWRKLKEIYDILSKEDTPIVAILTRYIQGNNLLFYLKKDFGEGLQAPFEDLKVRIPVNYIRFLIRHAGQEYMRFPITEQRKPHHWAWWDTKESYNRVKERIYRESVGIPVVIYGIGSRTEMYLQDCKDDIECIIDENPEHQGRLYKDILVFPFERLKSFNRDTTIIICADDLKTAQRKLYQEGYCNYKMYIGRIDSVMINSADYRE